MNNNPAEHIIDEIITSLGYTKKIVSKLPLDYFLNYSPITQHLRHIIEEHKPLLNIPRNQVLDFSNKERDFRIEEDREYCIDTINTLIADLHSVFPKSWIKRHVKVVETIGSTKFTFESESESLLILNMVLKHTIHHLATIQSLMSDEGIIEHWPEEITPFLFTKKKKTPHMN